MTDGLVQGAKAGDELPPEMEAYSDPNTGARVRRLTDFKGIDDRHMHFKTDGWYDDGTKLLMPLQRPREMNLFSIDLRDGTLRQLTDLPGIVGSVTSVNEADRELYFAYKHESELEDGGLFAVYALHLDDLSIRRTFTPPERFESYVLYADGVTADGSRLLVRFREPFAQGNVDERLRHRSFPHCAIGTVPLDGSGSFELVHDEEYWINHFEPSPTDPESAIFRHEGPPDDVDHRMWGVDLETDRVWRLGTAESGEYLDEEYWLRNGEEVGYLGRRTELDGRAQVHGVVRHDDGDYAETRIPDEVTHTHATSRRRFICECDPETVPRIFLYEYDEGSGEYRGPWELATYDWNDDRRRPQPYARFSPDGSTVLFSADLENDEGNVFLVDVPDDFEELPRR